MLSRFERPVQQVLARAALHVLTYTGRNADAWVPRDTTLQLRCRTADRRQHPLHGDYPNTWSGFKGLGCSVSAGARHAVAAWAGAVAQLGGWIVCCCGFSSVLLAVLQLKGVSECSGKRTELNVPAALHSGRRQSDRAERQVWSLQRMLWCSPSNTACSKHELGAGGLAGCLLPAVNHIYARAGSCWLSRMCWTWSWRSTPGGCGRGCSCRRRRPRPTAAALACCVPPAAPSQHPCGERLSSGTGQVVVSRRPSVLSISGLVYLQYLWRQGLFCRLPAQPTW